MAVNTKKLLPPPSSAIVKVGKIKVNKPQENKKQKSNTSSTVKSDLEKIRENLQKIYGLVLDTNKLIKKDLDLKRKLSDRSKFAAKEKRLESKNAKKAEKEDVDKSAP